MTAEEYLRQKYGAHRGHSGWRAIEEAFNAGAAAELAERDELMAAAQAVIDRWDTPLWKDAPATATFIARLRRAVAAIRARGEK